MPGRPQEVKLATCSADKARKLLGYHTEYSLKRGLEEMVEYIKDRGTKKFRYHLDIEIINDKTPKTKKDGDKTPKTKNDSNKTPETKILLAK